MSTPKFLVIDDDKALLDVVQAILESLGCKVEPYNDGARALQELENADKAKELDAIFLDIMMPGMNGYEVLEELKKRAHTKNIPVIMLTAKGGFNEIISGYNVGADYYVIKPVTKDQLVYSLDLVLGSDDKGEKRFFLPEA